MSAGLGIDLGTANTLVHVQGRGILLREPSVVAVSQENPGRVIEIGVEAKRMIGRTPGAIIAARPLKDGVIADFDQTEQMLRYFIARVQRRRMLFSPQIVIGVPSGITEVERIAVIEAARKAGARQVYLIAEPMAAAIGVGLPVTEPIGSMIVDIGGGTSEVAVIALRGIVAQGSIRIAGDEIDEAIIDYMRNKFGLLIGNRTAEDAKIEIGSALPLGTELIREVGGRDLTTGLPRAITLRSQDVREAIKDPVNAIVSLVSSTLESTPPELASDILRHGIVLAGGGALLKGLDALIAKQTGMPVHIAADPLSCVALGAGKFLERLQRDPSVRELAMEEARFGFV
ncbi:MAG: rod shape-determining protein [Capsulimonadaceae bacterium]|nr:rod shape-determining protein [Capsulimonadaceae bacterium]